MSLSANANNARPHRLTKLGGAGKRFGDYLCVDRTNLPFPIYFETQHSTDLLPTFRSLSLAPRPPFAKLLVMGDAVTHLSRALRGEGKRGP